MSLDNSIALVRQTTAFAKLETAWGVLAMPAAADALAPLAVPTATQPESFTPSAEITGSRSLISRFRDKTPAGSWSLAFYPRPAGSAGAKPAEAAILKAALGAETVNAGASVVYTPALELPSFSLCFREGHSMRFVSGCVVENLALSLESKGALRMEASGKFKQALLAGSEETASGSTTTVINLAAGGARLFDAGAYVQVGSDDHAGQGYLITSVDEGADTITLDTALSGAPAAGVLVKGFLPAPSLGGAPVASQTGTLTLAGAQLLITSGTVTVANSIKMVEEEVSGESYPTGFSAGPRSVTGQLKCFFRRTYANLFRSARSQAEAALVLAAGEGAGQRLSVSLAKAMVDTPELAGEEFQRELSVAVTGLASAGGEDEISLTYN